MSKLGNLSLLAALAMTAPLGAQAVQLKPIGSAQFAQSFSKDREAARVIVEENFAKFTEGSESTPDATNIANLRTGAIDAKYTAVDGWTGAAIYQAGGVCAILTGMYSGDNGPYEDTGFLRTPMGDYSGAVTVTFRARLLSGEATSDVMAVILNSTQGRLEAHTIDVTAEWKTFTLEFKEGLFSVCLFEFSMLKEKVLIDDITITSVQTSIPAPTALNADNFTKEGFTAHWTAVEDADNYKVTVYSRDVEKATEKVDFEGLNLIDDGKHINSENSGLPEGWSFVCGNGADTHVSDKGVNGSTGMVFAGTDDGFMTPLYDRPIRDFSFYAAHPAGIECFSQLRFSCLVDGSWVGIGNIDIERIAKDGETINFSSRIPEGTTQIKMLFNKNAANDANKDVSIVVDNIRVMTEPDSEPVIVDRVANGTELVLTDLDPDTDYSYTVKAFNSDFSSEPSNEMMAVGLATPELLRPANVTENSYTALWTPSPKADGYVVSNYRVFTAPEDQKVTVMYENFDKVTEGTLSAPVGLYNTYFPRSLDEYTTNPGWLGLSTYLVEGMLGTRSFFTAKGSIQTPALNLSASEGRFTVDMMIVGDTDAVGDSIVVQAGERIFQRQLISEHTTPIKMSFDFDCGEEAMPLLIYSYGGKPFYIDEITVSQTFKKGQQNFTETEAKTVEGHDVSSVPFENLVAGNNENFAYRVFAYRDFYGSRVYSVSDAAMNVTSPTGVTDGVVSGEGMTVYTEGQTLVVDASDATRVTVYGVNSVKVADVKVQAGSTKIELPGRGLYLVVAESGFVTKVIVR